MVQIKANRVKAVLANLFKLDIQDIHEDTSMDTVEEWDSLNHLKLVLALEEELEISFTEEETIEILSYALIKEILKDHGLEMID